MEFWKIYSRNNVLVKHKSIHMLHVLCVLNELFPRFASLLILHLSKLENLEIFQFKKSFHLRTRKRREGFFELQKWIFSWNPKYSIGWEGNLIGTSETMPKIHKFEKIDNKIWSKLLSGSDIVYIKILQNFDFKNGCKIQLKDEL